MREKALFRRKENILIFFFVIWLSLQFLLVFYKTPIVIISDEILYKRISYSIFQFQPPIS